MWNLRFFLLASYNCHNLALLTLYFMIKFLLLWADTLH